MQDPFNRLIDLHLATVNTRLYDMAIDPICKMEVDEATALKAERDGQTYYFCCEHCRITFLGQSSAPAELHQLGRHSRHSAKSNKPQRSVSKYYCPMCEGVTSDKPGDCPKCGMALESSHAAAPTRKF